MSSNLISSGWLRIQKKYLDKFQQEIAAFLDIPESAIKRIECWPHQILVVIAGVRAKFVSYRCLPTWIAQVVAAIGRVVNFEQLKQLGNILRSETENHPYEPEAVEELREAYRQKQNHLKEIKPQLEHQKKAQEWLESWAKVIPYCRNHEFLEQIANIIEFQSQEFADLPEIISKIQEIISHQSLVIST